MSEAPKREPARAPSGLRWRTVLWILVAAYAIVFLILNADRVEVSFVFFTTRTSLVWLILLSMALGALLAYLGPRYVRYRRDRRNRRSEP